jgi:hypothetical protein
MRILILEDNGQRVNTFIEKFRGHELIITENAYDAIEYLTIGIFDVIFLDNDLGEGNGSGTLVSSFLRESPSNSNNEAFIIAHSWNVPAVKMMLEDLPQAVSAPFNTDEFFNIKL